MLTRLILIPALCAAVAVNLTVGDLPLDDDGAVLENVSDAAFNAYQAETGDEGAKRAAALNAFASEAGLVVEDPEPFLATLAGEVDDPQPSGHVAIDFHKLSGSVLYRIGPRVMPPACWVPEVREKVEKMAVIWYGDGNPTIADLQARFDSNDYDFRKTPDDGWDDVNTTV